MVFGGSWGLALAYCERHSQACARRLDRICRPRNAWRLHGALRGSRLQFVDNAGHNPFEPPMATALVAAANHFLMRGDFTGWDIAAGDRADGAGSITRIS